MFHPILHFCTITRHRHLVIANCFHAGIFFQGLWHDLSKYAPAEFLPGSRFYQGSRSPNAREREVTGYSAAWLHHKGRNRHHYEYWIDLNPESGLYEPVEMPLRYVAEMFCDRLAASKIYKGSAYKNQSPLLYFQHSKSVKQDMHPKTAARLLGWLTILAEQGESAAFRQIRQDLKQARVSQKASRAKRRS